MLISAIIGATANAARGGQWRGWLTNAGGRWAALASKAEWVSSDGLNAFIYGLTVLCSTGDVYFSAICAALMWLGAKPGWGDYIGALGGWRIENLHEVAYIDWVISPLVTHAKWWGFAGLTLRGLLWGVLLAAPFAWAHEYGIAASFVACSALMGVAYWAAIAWEKYRQPQGQWEQAGWGLGEIFYGAVLWYSLP